MKKITTITTLTFVMGFLAITVGGHDRTNDGETTAVSQGVRRLVNIKTNQYLKSRTDSKQHQRLEPRKLDVVSMAQSSWDWLRAALLDLVQRLLQYITGGSDNVDPSDVLPLPVASDSPSSVPSDIPSSVPSVIPSSVPSDIPSSVPSDIPSSVPSDVPSSVPSGAPSTTPSDVPSQSPTSAPSGIPSLAPSGAPSIVEGLEYTSDQPSKGTVFSRDQNSIPDGFEACPATTNVDLSKLPKLTIIYRYRLALLPGHDVATVSKQIEAALQSVLLDGVCTDSSGEGALAISPEPSDLPGSTCEQRGERLDDILSLIPDNTTTENATNNWDAITTCYTVAGRATIIISDNSVLDTAGLYCKALESIRAYIASGVLVALVDGVQAVESPLLSRIIPSLCGLLPGVTSSNSDNGEQRRRLVDISSALEQPTSMAVAAQHVSDNGSYFGFSAFGFLFVACAFGVIYTKFRNVKVTIQLTHN